MATRKKKKAQSKVKPLKNDPEKALSPVEIKRLLAVLKAKVEYPDRKFDVVIPNGFKESFECQPAFRGWLAYHVTWDVSRSDPWTAKHRPISLEAEWHRELIKVVPVIAPDGTIMEADEWEQKQHLTRQPE